MKVILCEDVDNLGDMGETVTVAAGYARNFLLPRRLAVQSDSASAKQIEHEMRIIGKREEKRRAGLIEVASTLNNVTVAFTAKVGAEGKLFGSITNLHISSKLEELGHKINRRKIQLSEPIRSLGEHEVAIQLTSGVAATIKVIVNAEEPEPGETEKKAVAAEAAPEGTPQGAEVPPAEGATESPEEDPVPQVVIHTGDGGEAAEKPVEGGASAEEPA